MKKRMTRKYIQELLADCRRCGVLRDTGLRRNGEIVWAAVPPEDFRCPVCGGGFAGLARRTCATCITAARVLLQREG